MEKDDVTDEKRAQTKIKRPLVLNKTEGKEGQCK